MSIVTVHVCPVGLSRDIRETDASAAGRVLSMYNISQILREVTSDLSHALSSNSLI